MDGVPSPDQDTGRCDPLSPGGRLCRSGPCYRWGSWALVGVNYPRGITQLLCWNQHPANHPVLSLCCSSYSAKEGTAKTLASPLLLLPLTPLAERGQHLCHGRRSGSFRVVSSGSQLGGWNLNESRRDSGEP